MKDALIYDDACGFCMWTLSQIPNRITDQYEYIGFSELTPELEEELPPAYEDSFHIIRRDAEGKPMTVHSGGDGLQHLFAGQPSTIQYNVVMSPLVTDLSDLGYMVVAKNRGFFGNFVSADRPE